MVSFLTTKAPKPSKFALFAKVNIDCFGAFFANFKTKAQVTNTTRKKAIKYFIYLGATFILIEIFLYATPFIFANLIDRARLKSAMFNFRDETEILFLGSSRSQDGISPKVIEQNLKGSTIETWKGFNGSITGANIHRLKEIFDRTIEKEGLKLVVIEISVPQLNEQEIYTSTSTDSLDFEGQLHEVVADKMKLIEWRKAFRMDNLKNAPAILAADQLEGSEFFRANALKDFFSSDEFELSVTQQEAWQPTKFAPIDSASSSASNVPKIINELTSKAQKLGVKTLLVIPPLVNKRYETEHTPEVIQLYQEIANATGKTIINFSDAKVSESLFRDKDSHLNKEGRFVYSTMLAQVILSTINQ